ncbi:MAG: hypothetical protein JWO73_163 [Candidatus Taylorbacteria bacterium]|nr:hypothetical protein [Candidatus Taylorbacteria bacterium]
MNQDKTIEDIANWIFPGLGIYYRDTPLTEEQICKYSIGSYLRNNFFIDTSSFSEGVDGKTRYIIVSSKVAPMYKFEGNSNTVRWKLSVVNANSYFKILDVYAKNGKTQILLLHVPKKLVEIVSGGKNIDFDLEKTVIDTARQRFDEMLDKKPAAEFSEVAWRDRIKYPIGLDPSDNLCDINKPVSISGPALSVYGAIEKIVGDQTGLNT